MHFSSLLFEYAYWVLIAQNTYTVDERYICVDPVLVTRDVYTYNVFEFEEKKFQWSWTSGLLKLLFQSEEFTRA